MSILHKLPRPLSCCCCIDLRTGAIILGVLGIIGNLGNVFKTFQFVANFDLIEEELIIRGTTREDVAEIMPVAKAVFIFLFMSALLSLIVAALLLVGALKRDKKLLAIYLYINLFWVGLIIVLGILMLFVLPVAVIGLAIGLAISLYYLFCINAYYLLLEQEQNGTLPPPYQNKSAV